jgi:hypothetical protein
MKKLIILFAILLIGASRVSAQGPYQVLVHWEHASPFYCQSELSSNYVFVVTLNIYDVVNGVEVTDDFNIESWTTTSSTFDTDVEDWCIEAPKTPNLRVHVTVNMVNTSTHVVYCNEESTVYKTCEEFSNGVYFGFTFY